MYEADEYQAVDMNFGGSTANAYMLVYLRKSLVLRTQKEAKLERMKRLELAEAKKNVEKSARHHEEKEKKIAIIGQKSGLSDMQATTKPMQVESKEAIGVVPMI